MDGQELGFFFFSPEPWIHTAPHCGSSSDSSKGDRLSFPSDEFVPHVKEWGYSVYYQRC